MKKFGQHKQRERRPGGGQWQQGVVNWEVRPGTLAISVWHAPDGMRVISSLCLAALPGTQDQAGPTWHVSVSVLGRRPTDAEFQAALAAFGMLEGDEDNHHPGVARHVFMPLDPAYRKVCECKTDETLVTEPDGYAWSNSTEGCRGCEYEQIMLHRDLPHNRCPIHKPGAPPYRPRQSTYHARLAAHLIDRIDKKLSTPS